MLKDLESSTGSSEACRHSTAKANHRLSFGRVRLLLHGGRLEEDPREEEGHSDSHVRRRLWLRGAMEMMLIVNSPLAHSMRPAGESNDVCLFSKDPQAEHEELLKSKNVKGVTTVRVTMRMSVPDPMYSRSSRPASSAPSTSHTKPSVNCATPMNSFLRMTVSCPCSQSSWGKLFSEKRSTSMREKAYHRDSY